MAIARVLSTFRAAVLSMLRLVVGLFARPAADVVTTPPLREPRSDETWTDRDWTVDVHVYEHGGTRVHYLDHGTGPTMVLLHGMGCCWEWWLECIPTLARDRRIIAIDTPGFGDSDTLPGPVRMADYADVVAGVMRHAEAVAGTVVGHSMGGLIAIALAERHPHLVHDLVLVDSGGVPMSERRLDVVLKVLGSAQRTFARPRVIRTLVRSRAARRLLLRGAMRNPDSMSDELAAVVIPKLNAPGFGVAITASAVAVRESAPERIDLPTLLVWGEKDLFAPVRTAQDMLARLPSGRLVVLPGLGHTPLIEAPEALCDLLLGGSEWPEVSSGIDRTGAAAPPEMKESAHE